LLFINTLRRLAGSGVPTRAQMSGHMRQLQ
jgi:hypothetical protein